ncbi:hypothetical protein IEQ34_011550 [Dendrobium chrysotoxum]|uniref:Uncharacterized protein n=1 Tax=Dendrobium chrysotoxum TaxID=161865 RepID=A0AAV7GRZ1_DENCH|nr:hypothetical protein IEQ34_011550 [Dendrobium chrysotoxum]
MTDNSKDGNQRRTLETTSKRSSSKNPKNTAGGGLTDASKIIPPAHDGDRRRSDDVASILTSDSLAAIHKKFHVPNDVLIIAPKRTDRAHSPPQGFVAVYEMTLRAGLRFPPAPELLDIFKACGVALPQFLCSGLDKATNLDIEAISLKAVEEFKKYVTYRREIQHLIQEAYEKLFDVEVKDLERQSLEEGFTRGFLKGVRLVHRKTGVDIEGLTPSQASEDSSPDSGDEYIESEFKKALLRDDDDIDIA